MKISKSQNFSAVVSLPVREIRGRVCKVLRMVKFPLNDRQVVKGILFLQTTKNK